MINPTIPIIAREKFTHNSPISGRNSRSMRRCFRLERSPRRSRLSR